MVMNEPKINNQLIIFVLVVGIAGSSFGVNQKKAIWPELKWEQVSPEDVGMDTSILLRGRDYALTGGGSGCVIRYGRLVAQWGDQSRRYDLKSTTKAIGVTALGLTLKDGKIKSINDSAKQYHPHFGTRPESNVTSGQLDKITLFNLATQTAGFDKSGGYTKLIFKPGTKWAYSDGGPNWLAECITLVYGQDLNALMFERVFGPIGITKTDLTWRDNAYRPKEINGIKRREFGSGISANVNAMARIGYLYLRSGRWKDKQIIPTWFVDMARTVPRSVRGLEVVKKDSYFNASDHYGLLWWNNTDGTMAKVPQDTYWSWGLYDSLIVVIPSLDIVIARAGKSLNKARNSDYKSIEPLIEPIVLSVTQKGDRAAAPYPSSPVIKSIEWAPVDTIIRRASGSDNWPITWADDDNQYTAYGDGWGFEPKTKKKLSLGIVKIVGSPLDIQGINVRTDTGERVGQGPNG
ncbi:MAG: serine hydrolase domain-containing protein, partial [Planctomycetota bacterium]